MKIKPARPLAKLSAKARMIPSGLAPCLVLEARTAKANPFKPSVASVAVV